MAFINEYISEGDKAKYGIEAINLRYTVNGIDSRSWTIDKERNIYLRQVARGPREAGLVHQEVWTLFFESTLIEVGLEYLESTGGINQPCWAHVRVRYLKLPEGLQSRREEVIECLRDALLAYKDGGIYSKATSFTLTLDVSSI